MNSMHHGSMNDTRKRAGGNSFFYFLFAMTVTRHHMRQWMADRVVGPRGEISTKTFKGLRLFGVLHIPNIRVLLVSKTTQLIQK